MKTKGFATDKIDAKGHSSEERMDVVPLESLLAQFGEYFTKLPLYKFRELGLEKGQMDVQNFVTWLDLLSRVVKKDPTWKSEKAVDMLMEAGVTVEAVKVLLKLQGHNKFSKQAIQMYRYIAENVPSDSDAMVQVWKDMKLNPYHVFESLALYRPDSIFLSPGSSIQWLKYTERLRKDNADIQMTIEDIATALYDKEYDRTIIANFMEKVEKVDDLALLAKPLRHEFELLTPGRIFEAQN
ncbi:unnamed protein product [Hyaloperonospora brassicae]|uniref:RXLR phytopathogen effector protein WY-domain domain-containing protein n=1 Tax=Hyaloperonospora brassicae TaxID=162125 RepID=A0AAV0T090_HYABA|nr:unnamed protein product [Hyaloperonospora brassicae]